MIGYMKETHNFGTADSQPQVPVAQFTIDETRSADVYACDFVTSPWSIEVCRAVLNGEENARADRYRNARAQEQFIRSRGYLRFVLSRYLGCDPETIEFSTNAFGKPQLAETHPASGLHFNVSHTDGIALIAVAAVPIGVDVERLRDVPAADGLIQRYFHEVEQRQFHALATSLRTGAFLKGWVCKEAVLKGIGCGVRDLDRCIVDLHPELPATIVGPTETATNWSLVSWAPVVGVLAAVAVGKQKRP